MPNDKVAPDASLIDHVAEFSYKETDRIQALYEQDRWGYSDALAKFVQTMACTGGLFADKDRAVPDSTSILRERLVNAGRMEFTPFFDAEIRSEQEKSADEWLDSNWDNICRELNDREWHAETALIGHLRREFFYFWMNEDSNWSAAWKNRRKVTKALPPALRERLLRSIEELARIHNVSVERSHLVEWIEENVATHFQSFGKYYLNVKPAYMPSYSRSALRFLESQSPDSMIDRIVMPFIGLAALKRVKHRNDLVERVIEWNQGEGRAIVDGLHELQHIYLSEHEPENRERLLKDTNSILKSVLPRQVSLALNLLRVGASAVKREVNVDTLEAIINTAIVPSRRWLWKIRERDRRGEWERKLRDLLV